MTHDTLRAAAEALKELVACQDLKHAMLSTRSDPYYLTQADAMEGEYERRKPLAWQRAREALAALSQEPPAAAPAQGEPLLLGRWHHGEGFMVCGTMRALRADFDTNPSKEFQGEFFDWVCNTMNASVAQWRSRAALPHPPAEGSQT